jgi:Fe-S cluster biosynthesis and repair protein YggX
VFALYVCLQEPLNVENSMPRTVSFIKLWREAEGFDSPSYLRERLDNRVFDNVFGEAWFEHLKTLVNENRLNLAARKIFCQSNGCIFLALVPMWFQGM